MVDRVARPLLRVYPGLATLERAAAAFVVAAARRAVTEGGAFHWFLSGGRTPEGVYRLLAESLGAQASLVEAIHLYWGDERCVAPDHKASNYRMAKAAMLDRLAIPPGQIHRMEGERPDPGEAARAYESLMPDVPDLVLLGVGADGHTASLFPGADALREASRRCVAVKTPSEPPWRLTITPPVLAAAREVAVLVAGATKARTLVRIFLEGACPEEVPAALGLRGVWYVDREAAAELVVSGRLKRVGTEDPFGGRAYTV